MKDALDFFDSSFGLTRSRGIDLWKNRRLGFATDKLFDVRLRSGSRYKHLVSAISAEGPLKILVVGVRSARNHSMMDRIVAALGSEHHTVSFAIGDVGNRGKLENINLILSSYLLDNYDWIIMIDDDIVVPPKFIDIFIATCLSVNFKIGMPAHRFNSYSGYEITRRGWGTLARTSHYVEVGPLTAFQRDVFSKIFPLPELQYGWGVDLSWSLMAMQNDWSMGIVDTVPIRHFRPIGVSYSRAAATEEACGYIAEQGHLSREETFKIVRRFPA